MNAYKLVTPVVRNNRRPLAVKKVFTGAQARPLFLKVRRRVKRRGRFNGALAAKQFAVKGTCPEQGRLQKPRPRRGLFTVNKEALTLFSFHLERVLAGLACYPVELRLKNVFSLKKTRRVLSRKPALSILNLCRGVYKKANSFWKLQRFLFLKDVINILGLSFFYQRSELIAGYLADVVRVRRKFFFELKRVKSLLPYFKEYYFFVYGASLKINILGKLFGQRKRRFRCFTLSEGVRFSTQDINVNLSYSLART